MQKRTLSKSITVAEVKAILDGASVFSTVDTSAGLLVNPTPFNTPFGKYKFFRMSFGLFEIAMIMTMGCSFAVRECGRVCSHRRRHISVV